LASGHPALTNADLSCHRHAYPLLAGAADDRLDSTISQIRAMSWAVSFIVLPFRLLSPPKQVIPPCRTNSSTFVAYIFGKHSALAPSHIRPLCMKTRRNGCSGWQKLICSGLLAAVLDHLNREKLPDSIARKSAGPAWAAAAYPLSLGVHRLVPLACNTKAAYTSAVLAISRTSPIGARAFRGVIRRLAKPLTFIRCQQRDKLCPFCRTHRVAERIAATAV